MKMTVYIDLLILINILTNYIFSRLTALFTSSDTTTAKLILSSLIGSLFSLLILFDIPEILSFMIRVSGILVCIYISFGYKNRFVFVKHSFTLLSIYMLFTGFLLVVFENSDRVYVNSCSFYISINPVCFVVAITAFYLVITAGEFLLCRHDRNYIYTVIVETCYGSFTAMAFYDTGFKVKDILCNNDVLMCSFDYLKKQPVYEIVQQISDFYQSGNYSDKSVLPLFYSDMSGPGMLAAFKPVKVTVKNNTETKELKNVIIAVSKMPFSNQYEMIFGTDIHKRLGD